MIFRWRKKRSSASAAPAAVSLPPDVPGILSTDMPQPSNAEIARRMAQAVSRSIQIDPAKMTAHDAQGVAMDETLQQAKYANSGSGVLPLAQLEWYGAQGFIGWQLCAILSQHWLIDKACTMPAKDAIRHGWEVVVNGGETVTPEAFDKIKKEDKRYAIKRNCLEFIRQGRIFGIRHALFLNEGIDYELPFNPDGIQPGMYRGITQIDPYWIAPELDRDAAANPAAKDFYEPTWWRVNGKRIHRSHFVIMRNGDQVPDILKPSYFYGGIPTPQKIYERVYAAERTANEAPLLAMSKRLTVLNLDLTQALADPVALATKMEQWSQLMNNFGIKVVGQEEKIAQFDTTLNGLDETVMTQYQLVAAAANVPATKLLGTTPKGFNSTGEYEEASYHEELESIQENELTPLIERHLLCVMRSSFGNKTANAEISWNPVDSPTAGELADINVKKGQYYAAVSGTGAVDGFDIRQAVIKDPDSGFTGIPDIVVGGPGDREHEKEMAEAAMEPDEPPAAAGEDSGMHFDPATGTLNGARVITHQRYLDDDIVLQKMAANDFVVNVTPPYEDGGKMYCMVTDGHHSLAAALRARVCPVFVEGVMREVAFNAITGQATDDKNNG